MKPKVYTVSQVNRYIRGMMEDDVILGGLFVGAEISNFKRHTSGHMYFTLKDDSAAINAVMFRGNAISVPFAPENGMKVIAYGRVSLYEKTGQYQLYVEVLEPAGKGGLQIAFEQLVQKLESEGLFDPRRKKAIPASPGTVAILTSPTGAAVRDVIEVAGRRDPNVKLVVVPVLVQGEQAAASIVAGLRAVNEWGKADLIILGRGGGSLEDLWCFNEEAVARAVAASRIPVVTAVGHETDTTIADFVADLRAPTPSAAAEMTVPDNQTRVAAAAYATAQLHRIVHRRVGEAKSKLESLMKRGSLRRYLDTIYQRQVHVEQLTEKMHREIGHVLAKQRMRFDKTLAALETLSPMATLRRGYALVIGGDGRLRASAESVGPEEDLTIRFRDGDVKVKSRSQWNA